MLSLIVARAKNNVIGRKNDLPWYLPADLKHFKKITTGKSVVMGRRTYDAIVARLGHGLPDRQNIVITRTPRPSQSGTVFVTSLQDALHAARSDETIIIGGAQIYEQALPLIEKIYLTEVEADIPGDTYFPELNMSQWQETAKEHYKKDDKNPYDFAFVELSRRYYSTAKLKAPS